MLSYQVFFTLSYFIFMFTPASSNTWKFSFKLFKTEFVEVSFGSYILSTDLIKARMEVLFFSFQIKIFSLLNEYSGLRNLGKSNAKVHGKFSSASIATSLLSTILRSCELLPSMFHNGNFIMYTLGLTGMEGNAAFITSLWNANIFLKNERPFGISKRLISIISK